MVITAVDTNFKFSINLINYIDKNSLCILNHKCHYSIPVLSYKITIVNSQYIHTNLYGLFCRKPYFKYRSFNLKFPIYFIVNSFDIKSKTNI